MHRAWRAADQRGELAGARAAANGSSAPPLPTISAIMIAPSTPRGRARTRSTQDDGGYPRRGGIPGVAADDEADGEADQHNSQQDAPRDGRDMAWIADVANTCRVARADALIWCKRRPSFQPARE